MRTIITLCQGISATQVQQQHLTESICDTLAANDLIGTTCDYYASDGLLMVDITTTDSDSRIPVKISTSLTLNNYRDIKKFIASDVSQRRFDDIVCQAQLVIGYRKITRNKQ